MNSSMITYMERKYHMIKNAPTEYPIPAARETLILLFQVSASAIKAINGKFINGPINDHMITGYNCRSSTELM